MSYDGFISYSHAADGRLAPALQSALQKLGKPFYRLRALRIFRDESSLAVTPKLWPTIQAALRASKHFVFMASPEAANSRWVKDELKEWLEFQNGSLERFHIVWTGGSLAWDEASKDFDWGATTALPELLKGRFEAEPLFLDCRWAVDASALSLRNPRFLRAVAKVSAALQGRSLDEIVGEDVRQHKIFRTAAAVGVSALVALAVLAAGSAYRAYEQRTEALHLASDAAYREANRLFAQDDQFGAVSALARSLSADPGNQLALDRLYHLVNSGNQPLLVRRFRSEYGQVSALAISGDGRRLLAAMKDGDAQLWGESSGATKLDLGRAQVRDIRFLASGDALLLTAKGDLYRLESSASAPRLIRRLDMEVAAHAYSVGQERLAVAGKDGRIAVLALPAASYAFMPPAVENIRALGFTGDGRRLVVVHAAGRDAFDIEGSTRKALEEFSDPLDEKELSVVLPDGLVAHTRHDPGGIQEEPYADVVAMPLEGDQWQTPRFEFARATALAADHEARFILATLDTGEVALMRPDGSRARLQHDGVFHAQSVPQGDLVVTASGDGTIMLWNAKTGRPSRAPLRHPAELRTLAVSPNGSHLLVSTGDGMLSVWDIRDRILVRPGTDWPTQAAKWGANGKISVRGGEYELRRKADKDGQAVWALFRGDGAEAIASYLHPLPEQYEDDRFTEGSAILPMVDAFMSKGGDAAVTIGGDTPPLAWRTRSKGRPIVVGREDPRGTYANNVYLDRKGDKALIAFQRSSSYRRPSAHYRMFSLADGKPTTVETGLRQDQSLLDASPDLRRIVVAEGFSVYVRDSATYQIVGQEMRHGDRVARARFASDGRTLCTVSRDGTMRIWDAATGFAISEPMVFDPEPPGFGGPPWDDDYFAALQDPEFSGDGKAVMFRSADERTKTGVWIATVSLAEESVRRLAAISAALYGVHSPQPAPDELKKMFSDRAGDESDIGRLLRGLFTHLP